MTDAMAVAREVAHKVVHRLDDDSSCSTCHHWVEVPQEEMAEAIAAALTGREQAVESGWYADLESVRLWARHPTSEKRELLAWLEGHMEMVRNRRATPPPRAGRDGEVTT